MLLSRDGETMPRVNNGTSIMFPRLSRTTNGRATHLISNQMVDPPTSDALPLTQDGGNCSSMKVLSSPTSRTTRLWMSQETETKRTRTSLSMESMVVSTNNGISSMLMNGRVNPKREK